MKKIVTFLALTALVFSCAFAQDKAADTQKDSKALLANAGTPDITTRVIQVEDKYSSSHPKATNVDLNLSTHRLPVMLFLVIHVWLQVLMQEKLLIQAFLF